MSASERDRASVIRRCVEEGLSRGVAAERLGIGVRQVKRLVRAWRQAGDGGLVSRRRGRLSNNRLPEERRAQIAALLAGKYEGFGPTLAAATQRVSRDPRPLPPRAREKIAKSGLMRRSCSYRAKLRRVGKRPLVFVRTSHQTAQWWIALAIRARRVYGFLRAA